MKKMLLTTLLVALCLTVVSAEDTAKRSGRSLGHLPILKLFKPEPTHVPIVQIPQPIWKVHKYKGVRLTPLGTIPAAHVQVQPLPHANIVKKLPSLDDIKSLLGTTSAAETVDAMRDLLSTREGVELVASYIKGYVGDSAVDITKMSQEEIQSFISTYYKYSTPAEEYKPPSSYYGPPTPKPSNQYGIPQNPAVKYEVPPSSYYGPPAAKPIHHYGPPQNPAAKYEAPPKIPIGTPQNHLNQYQTPPQLFAPSFTNPSNQQFQKIPGSFVSEFPHQQETKPTDKYGSPIEANDSKAEFLKPLQTYGAPIEGSDSKAEFIKPVETYGVPAVESDSKAEFINPFPTQGYPIIGSDSKADFYKLVENYGVPVQGSDSKAEVIKPIETYGAPIEGNDSKADFIEPVPTPIEESDVKSEVLQPVENYGPPASIYEVPVQMYFIPSVENSPPVQTYEIPSQPKYETPFKAFYIPSSAPSSQNHGSPLDGNDNDKFLPFYDKNNDRNFVVHDSYEIPNGGGIRSPLRTEFKINGQVDDEIVPFPLVSGLPPIESVVNYRTAPDEILDNSNSIVLDLPHDRKTPVFSFSSPESTLRRNVIETKFEQPGFSYTQLSSIPLEDVSSSQYSPDGITSYGEQLPTYIFDEEASETKVITARPDHRNGAEKEVSIKKLRGLIAKPEVKVVTEKPVVTTTVTTTKKPEENKTQRTRWVPKSRRRTLIQAEA